MSKVAIFYPPDAGLEKKEKLTPVGVEINRRLLYMFRDLYSDYPKDLSIRDLATLVHAAIEEVVAEKIQEYEWEAEQEKKKAKKK